MTFEEEFPSLKDKEVEYNVCGWKEYLDGSLASGLLYSEIDIRKHCIDKQIVKEAIENMDFDYMAPEAVDSESTKKDLLKELNLE